MLRSVLAGVCMAAAAAVAAGAESYIEEDGPNVSLRRAARSSGPPLNLPVPRDR